MKSTEVKCSWCGAKQMIVWPVNVCFYCSNVFILAGDGRIKKIRRNRKL